jgi:hypothetical protein
MDHADLADKPKLHSVKTLRRPQLICSYGRGLGRIRADLGGRNQQQKICEILSADGATTKIFSWFLSAPIRPKSAPVRV